MNYDVAFILNNIVFPCSRGTYLFSERPALEGAHAVLCAKEICELINRKVLIFDVKQRPMFESHNEGKSIVGLWAESVNLEFEKEVDVSVGVADVLVYADDIGIFEIGFTRPTKMLLLLKYIVRQDHPFTVHFWPYGMNKAFVFRNWK
ncbi:hypothetical protein A3D00_00025 [Candidatus Woesebacteria bacterium RIFCSPHIGHO2_02_FULL_38_9]|uniref:Uncharacterized protein n=1 Tax=Candidatus Woesebacteria bacterium RIFCSPHIGHO2_01_FULL_39_28 TaxID=1802496 RepID=A0A1F7YCP9_9BACT|nr:MAG: hypothetical protein A2627_02625 [Candidatus Woesebacteria bacterium RIFCSPHIGHO2_01_FULL_39_28]OGM33146.1 MAG: hypothetical protein A3D00_00025 [Candidatus Woesebacteria bacterium RIFCSPHIGHO2_02_FULL_38_9]OGM58397.1 MAG: hypothetical protein A3A50_02550 [Candidatus Woesebacteria bacterium RIFCSPLOWO2_01_FULL_38_20]